MEEIFIQLAIILVVAFAVSYLVRTFRQPLVVGYVIAGMVISPFILHFGASKELIDTFSHLGIAFLLFMVGLHLNPKIIKRIGKISVIIGFAQMALTFALGFLVCNYLLGFETIASVYVGLVLMFSSTIIVTKLLSDRGELDSLYSKISIGILIIQDLAVVAILVFITSMQGDTTISSFLLKSLVGGGITTVVLFLIGFFILPKVTQNIARNQELLFLFSLAWCFAIAALFSYIGFSIEIGALIAGIVLSISPYSTEISSKIRPLRDFFLIIFFIIIGLNIQLSSIGSIIVNALILSALVLIFKPLILMSLMAMFGHTKRNNFLVGTTLAQISEFSLIVLVMAVSLGHITESVLSTVTLTGLITITISTYMIMYSNQIYNKVKNWISIFEKKNAFDKKDVKKKYDAILFGYNRIGFGILQSLRKIKKDYLVVDFNPDTINDLKKLKIPCLYGDISDADFLQELPLDKLKMAVSTAPDFETNMVLIENVRLANPDAIIIVRAHQIKEALDLYKQGANYVLTPHFLGGEYVSKMIAKNAVKSGEYKEEKDRHIKLLKKFLDRGHEHPDVERG